MRRSPHCCCPRLSLLPRRASALVYGCGRVERCSVGSESVLILVPKHHSAPKIVVLKAVSVLGMVRLYIARTFVSAPPPRSFHRPPVVRDARCLPRRHPPIRRGKDPLSRLFDICIVRFDSCQVPLSALPARIRIPGQHDLPYRSHCGSLPPHLQD